MTKALAILVVVLLAALGWQWGRAEREARQADTYKAQLQAANARIDFETKARAVEKSRADKLQEAQDADHKARLAAEADARRADAAAAGLRERARQLAAAARCPASNPASAASGPPANAPADLLADMLERTDEIAGELARYADQARIAGQLCVRAYEALTTDPPPKE